jgi:hypothetical protein
LVLWHNKEVLSHCPGQWPRLQRWFFLFIYS